VKRNDRAILSHVLRPADGSPAVLIGDTHVTAMSMMGAANVSHTLRPPPPSGDSDVKI
jgi:hypothetical protein